MDAKQRKYLIVAGAAVALLFACCGGLGVIGFFMSRAAEQDMAEADRLWESGKKPEAVAKYKSVITTGVSGIDQSKRPTVFQRVIEFEIEQGNTSEARAMMEKAADFDVPLAFKRDDATALYAQVRAGREAKKKSTDPSEYGWDQKGTGDGNGKSSSGATSPSEKLTQENYERIVPGMTIAEVKAILGPNPVNVFPLKTDPKNVGMTWVSGPRSIAVGFYDGKVRNKTKVGF